MEEIKIGEYVRTKDGYLAKCINSHKYALDFDNTIRTSYGETWEYLLPEDTNHIKAHSFDIIDLIEVGDYVNAYKVLYNCNETEKEQCNGEYRKCIIVATGKTGEWKMVDWDIESIVTREQFENMKYVVGDK